MIPKICVGLLQKKQQQQHWQQSNESFSIRVSTLYNHDTIQAVETQYSTAKDVVNLHNVLEEF